MNFGMIEKYKARNLSKLVKRKYFDQEKVFDYTVLYLKDMYLLTAMGPPGGGRQQISRRLQSRFNLINMTFPFV
jgi:hypothetical protein